MPLSNFSAIKFTIVLVITFMSFSSALSLPSISRFLGKTSRRVLTTDLKSETFQIPVLFDDVHYSPQKSKTFSWGGSKWSLICFPRNKSNRRFTSVGLVRIIETGNKLNYLNDMISFKICARDSPNGPIIAEMSEQLRDIHNSQTTWGSENFCSFQTLRQKKKNNKIYFEVSFDTLPQLKGLVNLGNTCYMNSILQSLFHIPLFRELLVLADHHHGVLDQRKVGKELRNTFRALANDHDDDYDENGNEDDDSFVNCHYRHPNQPVNPYPLTEALGINPPFQQEDAQEFKSSLLYTLDDEEDNDNKKCTHKIMKYKSYNNNSNDLKHSKKTSKKKYTRLFEGNFKNTIKCKNINYSKSWEEPFMEIALDIAKQKRENTDNEIEEEEEEEEVTVNKQLEKYFKQESLEGLNGYNVKDHGKQIAVKKVVIKTLPQILHIQLKRFTYHGGKFSKLNNRVSFEKHLDLSSYCLDENDDNDDDDDDDEENEPIDKMKNQVKQKSQIIFKKKDKHCHHLSSYKLHSVVIHMGEVGEGHYYSYINTKLTNQHRPSPPHGIASKLIGYCMNNATDISCFDETFHEKDDQNDVVEGDESSIEDGWVKFDDVRVTPVSWKEVTKDAFGGSNKRDKSAYLLQYIRTDTLSTH